MCSWQINDDDDDDDDDDIDCLNFTGCKQINTVSIRDTSLMQ